MEIKEVKEGLEKEYFDVQNIGLVLIDIVPYENKGRMIDGFFKIFSTENLSSIRMRFDGPRIDNIPDIKKSGVLASKGGANIGFVFNSDLDENYPAGIKRTLPRMLKTMTIWVTQSVDFAYIVTYICNFKKEFYNKDIKDVFIKSDDLVLHEEILEDGSILKEEGSRGPEFEPSITDFQLHVETFLKNFSCGLYLNKNSKKNKVPCCPSIEVLATDNISFEEFETWEKIHLRFLKFLNFDFFHYSKLDYLLIGFQRREIYSRHSISMGLTILASKKHFEDGNCHEPIMSYIEYMVVGQLNNLFLLTYWTNYQVEITHKEWRKKIDMYLSDTSNLSKSSNVQDIKKLTQVYYSMIKEIRSFESYFLNESNHYELFNELFPRIVKNIKHFEPIQTEFGEHNVSEIFLDIGKSLLEEERNRNESLKRELNYLLDYTRNLTDLTLAEGNIDLQNVIRKYTKAIFKLTVLVIIIAAFQVSGLTIKDLMGWLIDNFIYVKDTIDNLFYFE